MRLLVAFTIGVLSLVSAAEAATDRLGCMLISKSYPSVAIAPQILFPFRGSIEVRRGQAALKIRPKNIRWFRETSVSSEEDRKAFEAEPPVMSPLEYRVQLSVGFQFAAQLVVMTQQSEAPVVLRSNPVRYIREDGAFPQAVFEFDLSEINLAQELRNDGYPTWSLQLECVHEIPPENR